MQTLGLLGPGASLSFPYIFKNTLEKNLGYSLGMFAKLPSRVPYFSLLPSAHSTPTQEREERVK